MPLSSQDEASIALYRWQQLKRRYPDPGDRLDVLMRMERLEAAHDHANALRREMANG